MDQKQPFDAAAAAASFCARRVELAVALREALLATFQGGLFAVDNAAAVGKQVNDKFLAAVWADCERAGVTLAELYGVAS